MECHFSTPEPMKAAPINLIPFHSISFPSTITPDNLQQSQNNKQRYRIFNNRFKRERERETGKNVSQ